MNDFTNAEKIANCKACTIARKMRDCAMCQFFNPKTIPLHFGNLPTGAIFQWGSIDPKYKKIDESTAIRLYPHHVGKLYSFAEKVEVTQGA